MFSSDYNSFAGHIVVFDGFATSYIPIVTLLSLAMFTNLGVYPVAFTLLSEVFPFKCD